MSRGPRSLPAWAAALAGLVVLAAATAYFALVWTASVDAPLLDDYDAVLGFLEQWLDASGMGARTRLLFHPHNEHVLAVPRAVVVLCHVLLGRLDFRALNLAGNASLLLLLGALFAGFAPRRPFRERCCLFAPAALVLLQPQHATALVSPTVSLSNAGALAFAALAFACLREDGRGRWIAGLLAAAAAAFSQGNGLLAAPLGALLLWLRDRRREAAAFAVAALALGALQLALVDPASQRTSPFTALAQPGRLLLYALHFAGCVAFESRAGSLALGAGLAASFVLLVIRGLPRRQPALFALLLFGFGSIAVNALLRAQQGAAIPLFQPRYRLYSALLLAATWLAWAEGLRGERALRRGLAAALGLAVAFSALSFRAGGSEVLRLSGKLASGLDRWWEGGDGGLLHPDFRKATFFLLEAYDAELLRLPPRWLARDAATPQRGELPPASPSVAYRLDAVYEDDSALALFGWADAGGNADEQQVTLVLASPTATWLLPTRQVARVDLPQHPKQRARELLHSGFHVVVAKSALAPGRYRVEVVVQRGAASLRGIRRPPLEIQVGKP